MAKKFSTLHSMHLLCVGGQGGGDEGSWVPIKHFNDTAWKHRVILQTLVHFTVIPS